MKRSGKISVILAVVVFAVIALVTGCEEQNLSDTRKSRLVAAENTQLKKDLDQRDEEIEKQKKLLAECIKEKEALDAELQKDLEAMAESVIKDFEEVIKFKEENDKLQAQVEELQKRLAESQQ